MKLTKLRPKPTKWEWFTVLLLLPVGIFFSNLDHYNAFLSTVGLGGSIGGLIGLTSRHRRWKKAAPEEQREALRQAGDERNVTIRDRASTMTMGALYVGLVTLMVAFELSGWKSGAFLCAGIFLVTTVVYAVVHWFVDATM